MSMHELQFKAVCKACKRVYSSIEAPRREGYCDSCGGHVRAAMPKRYWRMMDDIENEDGSPSPLVWLVPMVPDGEYCPITGEPDFEEESHHTAPDPKGPYQPHTVRRWQKYYDRKEREAALEDLVRA